MRSTLLQNGGVWSVEQWSVEQWSSGSEDETILKQYQAYYDSISSKLPERLLALDQEFILHDASVTGIETD